MVNDHNIIWNNCLDIVRKNVNPQSYRTWFEPIKPIKYRQVYSLFRCPINFSTNGWKRILLKCSALPSKRNGEGARLEYQILMENHKATGKAMTVPVPESEEVNSEEITNPLSFPALKTKFDPQLNERYTFDNFVEGECNKLARAAGLEIAGRPGTTSFNPLVIFGDTGLGKTHLSQAIGNAITKSTTTSRYCTLPQKGLPTR